jgi:peroxiredoxin
VPCLRLFCYIKNVINYSLLISTFKPLVFFPKFIVISNDLKEVTVGGAKSKVQIIAFVPSIDTDTCALETVYFMCCVNELYIYTDNCSCF